jgi:YjbE family integral membrane protein
MVLGVVLMDIVLSGDNAVVVAAAANGLPAAQRNKALVYGIGAAIVLRILVTAFAGWLLGFKGIAIIGGLALGWIAYRMVKSYFASEGEAPKRGTPIDLAQAVITIVIADISMSLDNVAAIAAMTRGHGWAMVFGLLLSVAIMGLGAKVVSLILEKYKWLQLIAAGLIVIVGLQLAVGSFFSR